MKTFIIYIKSECDTGVKTITLKAESCSLAANGSAYFMAQGRAIGFFNVAQFIGYVEADQLAK